MKAYLQHMLYKAGRWLLIVALLALGLYFAYSQIYVPYGPKIRDVDARLPTAFHSSAMTFWMWFLGSLALGVGSGIWVYFRFGDLRGKPSPEVAETKEADPTLVRSWGQIANLREGHERQPVYLIIADGDEAVALIAAAGLGPDAYAPDDPSMLLGFRTSEGLFIQCRTQVAEATSFVCRALAAAPGSPAFRGIIIQLSVATLLGSRSRTFGQAARDGLKAVAESTSTRCPAYVVVSGMEGVTGFLEFTRRRPPQFRTSARFGFPLPGGNNPPPESLAREYDRLIDWCESKTFELMETAPLLSEGNETLFSFVGWFRRARGTMLNFLEMALAGGDDPPEVLGCYFVATGATAEDRAYVEGVMLGKLTSDDNPIRWSRQTLEDDRFLRRAAIGISIVGGLGAGLAWASIFRYLQPLGWIDELLAATLVTGWVVSWYAILRPARRVGEGR